MVVPWSHAHPTMHCTFNCSKRLRDGVSRTMLGQRGHRERHEVSKPNHHLRATRQSAGSRCRARPVEGHICCAINTSVKQLHIQLQNTGVHLLYRYASCGVYTISTRAKQLGRYIYGIIACGPNACTIFMILYRRFKCPLHNDSYAL